MNLARVLLGPFLVEGLRPCMPEAHQASPQPGITGPRGWGQAALGGGQCWERPSLLQGLWPRRDSDPRGPCRAASGSVLDRPLQEQLQGFYGFALKILFPEETKAINPNYRVVICNNICFKYIYF